MSGKPWKGPSMTKKRTSRALKTKRMRGRDLFAERYFSLGPKGGKYLGWRVWSGADPRRMETSVGISLEAAFANFTRLADYYGWE